MKESADGQKKMQQRINWCVFCGTRQSKIVRHLERAHKDEPEVQEFSVLPPNSMARNRRTTLLRNKGNFLKNVDTHRTGKGTLVVAKGLGPEDRPKKAEHYCHCPDCFTCILKVDFYRHRCAVRDKSEKTNVKPTVRAGKLLLETALKGPSDVCIRVLQPMKDDKVGRIVKNCPIIRSMLELRIRAIDLNRIGGIKQLRQGIRLLGRFVVECRSLIPGSSGLEDILIPKNVSEIASAAIRCAKGEENTEESEAVSVPVSIGLMLKAAMQAKRDKAIIELDVETVARTKELLELHDSQWKHRWVQMIFQKKYWNLKVPMWQNLQIPKQLFCTGDVYIARSRFL